MRWLQILVPGLIAAAVTLLITPAVLKLAVQLRALDVPGGRKAHEIATPRLGGIAIVAGIVISLGPCLLLFSGTGIRSLPPSEIVWFTTAALIIFVLGLIDDIVGLDAFRKLPVQVLAAVIVVSMGWQFSVIRLPWEATFDFGAMAAPLLSILWIVGVTNAINFIDGLDGLAAGIVAIIASSLLFAALFLRMPAMVIATSAIVGACLAFLRHNWRPARIYMGDSGSLTLGFILATISLRTSVKASAAIAILVPILALGLPVLDTLLTMWYRFLRGHQRTNRLARVFRADRKHLHYLLLETQTKRSRVMWILYGLAALFCVMGIVVLVSDRFWLAIGFLGVQFAAVLVIRQAGLNAEARRLADERISRMEPGDVDGLPAAAAAGALARGGEARPEELEPISR